MQSQLLKTIPRIAHDFGPESEPLAAGAFRLNQVHSSTVVALDGAATAESVRGTPADALVNALAGKTVAVQTADCLPLLFASRGRPVVAATHAGWRGLHAGIVLKTLDALRAQGAQVQDLVVAIGPAIGPCCFEVDAKTFGAFQSSGAEFLFRAQPFSQRGRAELQAKATQNNLWVDLAGIARAQLLQAGVPAGQIDLLPVCTYCGGQPLASYRREFHRGNKANRQWSWIQVAAQ